MKICKLIERVIEDGRVVHHIYLNEDGGFSCERRFVPIGPRAHFEDHKHRYWFTAEEAARLKEILNEHHK